MGFQGKNILYCISVITTILVIILVRSDFLNHGENYNKKNIILDDVISSSSSSSSSSSIAMNQLDLNSNLKLNLNDYEEYICQDKDQNDNEYQYVNNSNNEIF